MPRTKANTEAWGAFVSSPAGRELHDAAQAAHPLRKSPDFAALGTVVPISAVETGVLSAEMRLGLIAGYELALATIFTDLRVFDDTPTTDAGAEVTPDW